MNASLALPIVVERIVAAWRTGVLSVPADRPPCAGMIHSGWPGVHAGMLDFLNIWGVEAARLGFGTRALFGVHRLAGAIRMDSTGALLHVFYMPVAALEPGVIHFANGLVNRGMTNPADSIPLWEFVRSARARAG